MTQDQDGLVSDEHARSVFTEGRTQRPMVITVEENSSFPSSFQLVHGHHGPHSVRTLSRPSFHPALYPEVTCGGREWTEVAGNVSCWLRFIIIKTTKQHLQFPNHSHSPVMMVHRSWSPLFFVSRSDVLGTKVCRHGPLSLCATLPPNDRLLLPRNASPSGTGPLIQCTPPRLSICFGVWCVVWVE